MTRLRSPAQRAPQTTAAAVVLLERYADRSAAIAAVQARRQAMLAKINGAADALVVPLVAELKDIAKQLKPWWAASIEELTGGKAKSVKLGGCLIGYRLNPPKVVFGDGDEEVAVTTLQAAELDALVRVKPSLDKPAILKLLEAERQAPGIVAAEDAAPPAAPTVGAQLLELGFGIEQKEVFFVDALAPVSPSDGVVADPDAGTMA